jgi:hypothetical protein
MKIKNLAISDVKKGDFYRLSYPIQPDLYETLEKGLPGIPLLIVDRDLDIIFGHDYFYLQQTKNKKTVKALQIDIDKSEALYLNYNLKKKLTGLNLYEKIVFLKKSTKNNLNIYQKSELDIPVNSELLEKLNILLDPPIKDLLMTGKLALKSALKLVDFNQSDATRIINLFEMIHFSNNQQLQILELIRETTFREKTTADHLFQRINLEKLMSQEMPQKKIIQELFRLRYPLFSEFEEQWETTIHKVGLPENFSISHFPFFDKNQVEVRIKLKDIKEIQGFLKTLKKIFES